MAVKMIMEDETGGLKLPLCYGYANILVSFVGRFDSCQLCIYINSSSCIMHKIVS